MLEMEQFKQDLAAVRASIEELGQALDIERLKEQLIEYQEDMASNGFWDDMEHAQKINQKAEKLALKRAFTDRVNDGEVIVVDDVTLAAPKTKEMVKFLNAVGAGDHVLIIVDEYSENTVLAMRNLPNVQLFKAAFVNTYWMLRYKKIVITKAGLEKLGQRLA